MKLFSLTLLPGLLFATGCKKTTFYPLLGSTGGAAVGSAVGGGIPGAAGGAVLGWGIGKGAALVEENQHLASTVYALNRGDVMALVDAGMAEQRGFLDKVIDGIYDLLTICGIAAALFFLVPLVYARLLHRKMNLASGAADRKEPPPP